MIVLPENAIDPAIASARPGHKAARAGGQATGGAAVTIDSPVIAAPCRECGERARAGSEAGRLAVAARIARCDVALDGRVAEAPDELAGAEVLVAVLDHRDLVAALDQTGDRRLAHRRLDVDQLAGVDSPARRIARRLGLLAVREHANDRLKVGLRLHVAAHDAEAHLRPPVLGEERRDDRVERTPPRRDAVRAGRIENET